MRMATMTRYKCHANLFAHLVTVRFESGSTTFSLQQGDLSLSPSGIKKWKDIFCGSLRNEEGESYVGDNLFIEFQFYIITGTTNIDEKLSNMTWKVEIDTQKKNKYYDLCRDRTFDTHEPKQHDHDDACRPHHKGIGRI